MRTVTTGLLLAAFLLQTTGSTVVWASEVTASPTPEGTRDAHPQATQSQASTQLTVTSGKSVVVENATSIRRVSVASGEIADAVAVSSNEVLVNGKAPGETSLIIWDSGGNRTTFEVHVLPNDAKLEAVRRELREEVGPGVSLTFEDGKNVFLRGTVNDLTAAERANTIASTLGKVVNLLRVRVPEREPQILLKVRFANLDRSATSQFGFNLFSLDPAKGVGSSTTGQFGAPPTFNFTQTPPTWTLNNLLNIFYWRPDLNIGAVLQDLETKQLLQILAEPNLLTVSGRPASFLAGGEFPFPTLQGGAAGVGQITIQFKEFGIRLNFIPNITPRGTIRLIVTPEVSSLDYANGLTISGYTIPGLSTRRVQTEVELQSGQSFVIAGLLDNQLTETMNRLPGFANIPILGKLFQSKGVTKSNTELLVMVTPELVAPLPEGVKGPDVKMPLPFLQGTATTAPQNPGPQVTGPIRPIIKRDSLPVEEMKGFSQSNNGAGNGTNGSAPSSAPGIPALPPIQPSEQSTPAPGSQPGSTNPSH